MRQSRRTRIKSSRVAPTRLTSSSTRRSSRAIMRPRQDLSPVSGTLVSLPSSPLNNKWTHHVVHQHHQIIPQPPIFTPESFVKALSYGISHFLYMHSIPSPDVEFIETLIHRTRFIKLHSSGVNVICAALRLMYVRSISLIFGRKRLRFVSGEGTSNEQRELLLISGTSFSTF
jgi:hypothetical protein